MRREAVKKWDVRSFERNADAAFWLNGLQGRVSNLKVESASATPEAIYLVVSYMEME